jgi:dihydrofolate reductase
MLVVGATSSGAAPRGGAAMIALVVGRHFCGSCVSMRLTQQRRHRRMGRTQYYTAATLDGFIADSGHSLDWLFQFGTAATDDFEEFSAGVGAAAMGASTYEWLLRHLGDGGGDVFARWPYTHPVWVFTHRTLPAVPGADVRFVQGSVVEAHGDMAETAAGRNVWIVGGGDLAGQFHDHGLLDELIVTIASVTLGSGKPLLPRSIVTPPLRLTSARTYGSDFVQLRYEVQRLAATGRAVAG